RPRRANPVGGGHGAQAGSAAPAHVPRRGGDDRAQPVTAFRATVALGSNLGDRLSQLRSGVERLGQVGRVVAVSALYETEPVGGPEQGPYLNAVVLVETELGPEALLAELHRIEGDFARTRQVHWGPRTLDLDLITF